jgi:hypothetical protein
MSDKHGFVRQLKFEDACSDLPEVTPWDGACAPFDVFICALGFEDRAPAISQHLAASTKSADGRRAVIFEYPGNELDNEKNKGALFAAVSSFCGQVEVSAADVPQGMRQAVRSAVLGSHERGKRRVVFDISAASGNLILSVMYALLELREHVELEILYSEPQDYFPDRSSYESAPQALIEEALKAGDESSMVEFGVAEVDVNELFPGAELESRPELVIAIPAFRTSRLVRCLQHLTDQPLASPAESVFWILGGPPSSTLHWRTAYQKQIVNTLMARLVGMEPSDGLAPKLNEKNCEVCSTLEYKDILRTLMHQIDVRTGQSLSIVHMGSKMQAIGVALCLTVRSEVRVCGARPQQFNASQYSRGVGAKWRLDLTELEKIVERLGLIGTLELQTKLETDREPLPSI